MKRLIFSILRQVLKIYLFIIIFSKDIIWKIDSLKIRERSNIITVLRIIEPLY